MAASQKIIEATQKYLMNTYNRLPVAFVKGRGSYLWDADGKKYLDFFSGLAVTNLGHGHPRVLYALSQQASQLIHASNLSHIEPQGQLARLLVENSFGDKVFFCNSGAEANEAAVKLARKHSFKKFGPGRHEIITMTNSFHGRTMAMITATAQEKYRKGFEPLLPGFRHAEFGNIKSLGKETTEAACAVLIEPIQGEGGVRLPPKGYFRDLRDFCREKNLLLVLDEVQTGIGRTGRLFAYQHFDIEPDLMTLAKALASGLPIGALVARDYVAEAFEPGDHASTFGGNPLVTAVGIATLKTILEERLSERAERLGTTLLLALTDRAKRWPSVKEIRGQGLMVGIDLDVPARPVVLKGLEKGLLINAVQEKTLRILPPLTVTEKEIEQGLTILDDVLTSK